MARVTVEDCLKNVKNRFELVIIAAKRARQLMRGKEPLVDWDNDKSTVVALREIAEGYTNFDEHDHEHEDSQERQFIAGIQQAIERHEGEKQSAEEAKHAESEFDDEGDDENQMSAEQDSSEDSSPTPEQEEAPADGSPTQDKE